MNATKPAQNSDLASSPSQPGRSDWKKPAILRMSAGVAEFGGNIASDGLSGKS